MTANASHVSWKVGGTVPPVQKVRYAWVQKSNRLAPGRRLIITQNFVKIRHNFFRYSPILHTNTNKHTDRQTPGITVFPQSRWRKYSFALYGAATPIQQGQQLLTHCGYWGSNKYKMLPQLRRYSLLLSILSVVIRHYVQNLRILHLHYLFAMRASIAQA